MGNVLKDQCKLDEAIDAYSKAISVSPNNAVAYNNMGNALQDLDKIDGALEAYKKAISIKPDYAEAYYNTGNALTDKRKVEEALISYKKHYRSSRIMLRHITILELLLTALRLS